MENVTTIPLILIIGAIATILIFGNLIAQFIIKGLGDDPFKVLAEKLAQQGALTLDYQTVTYSTEALTCAINIVASGNLNNPCRERFKIRAGISLFKSDIWCSDDNRNGELDTGNEYNNCVSKCGGKEKKNICSKYNIQENQIKAEITPIIPDGNGFKVHCELKYIPPENTPVGRFFAANPSLTKPLGMATGAEFSDSNIFQFGKKEETEKEKFVGNTWISCEKTGYIVVDDYVVQSPAKTDFQKHRATANNYCREKYGEKAYAYRVVPVDKDGKQLEWGSVSVQTEVFQCLMPEVTCMVNNFELPQEVSDAAKWLEVFGDPKYLVYWQQFPIEEDTWTYRAGWGTYILIASLSLFPPTKVGGAVLKGIKTGLITSLKTMVKKRLTTEIGNVIKRFVILYGAVKVAEGIDAADAYVDNLLDKINIVPNSIIIKEPYKQKTVYKLETNRPVMVKWMPRTLTNFKNFHLVSPCYLDNFKLKPEELLCNQFVKTPETPIGFCEGPNERPKGDHARCGKYDEYNINHRLLLTNKNIYETMNKIVKYKDKRLIEYINNKIIRVYLTPLSIEKGTTVYIEFKRKDGAAAADDNGLFINFLQHPNDYSSELFIGDKKEGEVDFNCYPTDTGQEVAGQQEKRNTCVFCERTRRSCPSGMNLYSLHFFYTVSKELKISKTDFFREGRWFPDNEETFRAHSRMLDPLPVIEITDDDVDGKYDNVLGGRGEYMVALSNIKENGEYTHFAMTNCIIGGAVVADFYRLAYQKSDVRGRNYCLRYQSTVNVFLTMGLKVLGFAGLIVSGFFSGGTSWAIAIGAVTAGTIGTIGEDRSLTWPQS